MKNYSDLQGINQTLDVDIDLSVCGNIDVTLKVNGKDLTIARHISFLHPILEPICFSVLVANKDYRTDRDSLVTIDKLLIDNINIVPNFNHLTTYNNDRLGGQHTNSLGFNGTWELNIDRPFYQWLHQATNQGWLLDPIG